MTIIESNRVIHHLTSHTDSVLNLFRTIITKKWIRYIPNEIVPIYLINLKNNESSLYNFSIFVENNNKIIDIENKHDDGLMPYPPERLCDK